MQKKKKFSEIVKAQKRKDEQLHNLDNFFESLNKKIKLKRKEIKVLKDLPPYGGKYLDIAVLPENVEEAMQLHKKATEIGEKEIYNTWLKQDLGYLRVEMVDYGKRKQPALLISQIQPAMFWEMPSSFRKKYKDWYKKLYEEIETKAKKQGINRILITTPRSTQRYEATRRKTQEIKKSKFPYDKLSQLYRDFPLKQGFTKRKVTITGQTTAFREGLEIGIPKKGITPIQRKLWVKKLRKH